MERREFLKLFGLGAAAAGAVALTMSPAAAASSLAAPGGAAPVDSFIRDLAQANGGEGEFAQYYYRRRWRRPSRPYYFRPYRRRWRRCGLRPTPWGWRRICRWY